MLRGKKTEEETGAEERAEARGTVMDRRDWRAGFIVVAALVQYLPWFLAAGEVQFIFYILPVVPFLVLAAVYVLRDLSEARSVQAVVDERNGATSQVVKRPWAIIAVGYVVLYVLMFLWFYPILTGWHLSYTLWRYHMWMNSWI